MLTPRAGILVEPGRREEVTEELVRACLRWIP